MAYASKAQLKTLFSKVNEKYAKKNGEYNQLTSGNSKQLIASRGMIDNASYIFRTAGGSADIGNRLNDKLVGGTIVWNVLPQVDGREDDGVTFTNNVDGSYTVNGTATDTATSRALNLISDHIYLFTITGNTTTQVQVGTSHSGNSSVVKIGGTTLYRLYVVKGETVQNETVWLQCFDLTKMFGSAIAEYVLSLEQAIAGAGVAWFKNLFPKPYYEYNAGELMSVCTNAHITRGFNAYNHSTGIAMLLGGNRYQITGAHTFLSYSTGETITPNENGEFTPSANGELTVTGGDETTTCVHLVWSGYRNGEYEPYVEHRYPLSPVELRGVPKLDSANNLYFDGDAYEKDGTVTRKYGIADLGTLNWVYNSAYKYFYADIPDKINKSSSICANYVLTDETYDGNQTDMTYKSPAHTSGRVFFTNKVYTDAAAFKAAMSGVYLVYELATPTTETADPFADPQIVDDFGTEEYVDALATAETDPRDVAIPVGHETFYQANLRDKSQNAPDLPGTTGNYLMHYNAETREATYIPVTDAPSGKQEIDISSATITLEAAAVTTSWYMTKINFTGVEFDAEDIIDVKLSNGSVYPCINNNRTQLVIYGASDLSSYTVDKVWKMM